MQDNTAPKTDDVELEELTEEAGAGSASTAGTASCPATVGTVACW